MKDLHDQVP